MSHPVRSLALASAAVLVSAGCGAGGYGSSSQPPAATSASKGAAHVAKSSLGSIIVDGSGRTLYMFSADSQGKSTCDVVCLQFWAPAQPPSGSKLPGVTGTVGHTTTTTRKPILTVAGRPLYTYSGDKAAGDVNGQGLNKSGGLWYVVTADGTPVKRKSSSSGGGYVGGY